MANKETAELRALCYPRAAIPLRRGAPFVATDILAGRMNFAQGDTEGLAVLNQSPTIADSWLQGMNSANAMFRSISNLEWVRFGSDGRFYEGASASARSSDSRDVQGFIVQGRKVYLDCMIPAPEGAPAAPTAGNFDQKWKAVEGKWRSVLPPSPPQRIWLINSGSEATAVAATEGSLPANRSFGADLRFSGLGSSAVPGFRLAWGNQVAQKDGATVEESPQWAIAMRHGHKPTLEQLVGDRWVILRRLDTSFVCNLTGGRYTVLIRRINGYLVITIGGESFHFLQTSEGIQSGVPSDDSASPDQNNVSNARSVPWEWGEGPLQVTAYNTRAQMSIMLIKYSNAADNPYSGSFSRFIPRREPIWNVPLQAKAAGWLPPGAASITTEVTVEQGRGVEYICTLKGSEQGIDTPFVNKITLYSAPVWVEQDISPLDISPAVSTWRVEKAKPPETNGDELQLEINRKALSKHVGGWESYVLRYNPIEFSVRWKYDDGSVGDWIRLFKGYIWHENKNTSGVNVQNMSLVCRDSIMRLTEKNARINHRYGPLDIAWLESGKSAFYGSDAVRSILTTALGFTEAERLNGNGDGQRYFSPSHYPLLSTDTDRCGYFNLPQELGGKAPPVTKNSFYFPPPFGRDALSWIGDFCEADFAHFLYAWPPGMSESETWPCPVYGRINFLIGARPVKYVTDVPDADAAKLLLLDASVENRPNSDINCVEVWAGEVDDELTQYLPAMRMAQARLPSSDINSAERTWEMVHIIRQNIGIFEGSAEAIAFGIINQIKNQERIYPTLNCAGDATLQWGDIVEIQQNTSSCLVGLSDITMRLHGKRFRVEGVTHSGSGEASGFATYQTQMDVRPFTSSGF
jgi:hypothetical protein